MNLFRKSCIQIVIGLILLMFCLPAFGQGKGNGKDIKDRLDDTFVLGDELLEVMEDAGAIPTEDAERLKRGSDRGKRNKGRKSDEDFQGVLKKGKKNSGNVGGGDVALDEPEDEFDELLGGEIVEAQDELNLAILVAIDTFEQNPSNLSTNDSSLMASSRDSTTKDLTYFPDDNGFLFKWWVALESLSLAAEAVDEAMEDVCRQSLAGTNTSALCSPWTTALYFIKGVALVHSFYYEDNNNNETAALANRQADIYKEIEETNKKTGSLVQELIPPPPPPGEEPGPTLAEQVQIMGAKIEGIETRQLEILELLKTPLGQRNKE